MPEFEPCESWAGPREGCYFGTGDEGLGYYQDPVGSTVGDRKRAREEEEEVEVTEEALKAVTVGFVRVDDCAKKTDENERKKPEKQLSKKEMKRLAKLTPEQRILLGHGDLFNDKEGLKDGDRTIKIHSHEPHGKKEYADLDPDVVRTIEAQKRKASQDPTAKTKYSYQKQNPHFAESNIQRQGIYLLNKEEQIKKRKLANQEEKMRSVTTRQNKPSWL